MKNLKKFLLLAAFSLTLASCCCERDSGCCTPCTPPAPRCVAANPCPPKACAAPCNAPIYYDNGCCR